MEERVAPPSEPSPGSVAAGAQAGELPRRVLGAIALRGATYEAVAQDARASGQARVVVALAVVAAAVGEATLSAADMAWQAVASLLHWGAWAGVVVPAVRRRSAEGRRGAEARRDAEARRSAGSAWAVALRVVGFAKAPGIVAALAPVPVVGGAFHVAVLPWMLATGVVAGRRGLGLSPAWAVLAALAGLLPYWAALALLF